MLAFSSSGCGSGIYWSGCWLLPDNGSLALGLGAGCYPVMLRWLWVWVLVVNLGACCGSGFW